MLFHSESNSFSLDLPDDWEGTYEDGIYSFICPEKIEGILQISVYRLSYDPHTMLQAEQKKYKSALLVDVGEYRAVNYALSRKGSNVIEYYWILGTAQYRLFCTFLVHAEQSKEDLDRCFYAVADLLGSIKIAGRHSKSPAGTQ